MSSGMSISDNNLLPLSGDQRLEKHRERQKEEEINANNV